MPGNHTKISVKKLLGSAAAFLLKSSFLLILWLPLISGCAQVISDEVKKEVDPDISFKDIVRDPDRYKGITIVWGGLILDAKPLEEGALIKVLKWSLDYRGMPQYIGFSHEKFIALNRQPLDLSIFVKGRTITIAGIVQGKRVSPWEEFNYSYPMILVREFHPWPGRDKDTAYNRHYYWAAWTLP